MQHPKAPVPHVEGDGSDWLFLILAPLLFAAALLRWLLGTLNLLGPGVVVETGVTPVGGSLDPDPGATYFVIGLTERGSVTEPILVRSMSEVTDKTGARVPYGSVFDDLQTFFAEGGGHAYIARVVGDGATVGTLILDDRAGAPLETIRLDAANPGAWSTQVSVEIVDGDAADTFRINVRLNDSIAEIYNDLDSPVTAVDAINNSSALLTATNLGSATAAPNNIPALLASTPLSAGTDDRASVVAADHVAAADALFEPDLGPGDIAAPGQPSSAVGAGLKAHAAANRRIALLAPASSSSVAQARAAALALRGGAGSESAALFYPHIQVPDGAGGTRTISPEGYVAAVHSRAIREFGPWRAPAGEIAAARYVTAVETVLSRGDLDTLADGLVNPIRTSRGGTPRLYGWRSLSNDAVNLRMLTAAGVLAVAAHRAEQVLERYVFSSPDAGGLLFAEAATDLAGIFEPWRVAGGLYEQIGPDGDAVDAGYVIDLGPNVNTPDSLARNEINAVIGLRVSPVGELIRVRITKVPVNSSL